MRRLLGDLLPRNRERAKLCWMIRIAIVTRDCCPSLLHALASFGYRWHREKESASHSLDIIRNCSKLFLVLSVASRSYRQPISSCTYIPHMNSEFKIAFSKCYLYNVEEQAVTMTELILIDIFFRCICLRIFVESLEGPSHRQISQILIEFARPTKRDQII